MHVRRDKRLYLSQRRDSRGGRGVGERVLIESLTITMARKHHYPKNLALVVGGHTQELVRMAPWAGMVVGGSERLDGTARSTCIISMYPGRTDTIVISSPVLTSVRQRRCGCVLVKFQPVLPCTPLYM